MSRCGTRVVVEDSERLESKIDSTRHEKRKQKYIAYLQFDRSEGLVAFALEIHVPRDIIRKDRARRVISSLGEHLVYVPLICHRGEKESAVRKATLDEYECSPFSIHAASSRSPLRAW